VATAFAWAGYASASIWHLIFEGSFTYPGEIE
jgi:hypothetical protein